MKLRLPIRILFLFCFLLLSLLFWQPHVQAIDSVGGGACKRTGCSGQVCSDQDLSSTCEWKQEYSCYQYATCQRQANGMCGWTKTPAFTACLNGDDDTNATPKPTATPTNVCQTLWYIDSAHRTCTQRQFCGSYMYNGLQTFATEQICKYAVNSTSLVSCNGKCQQNADCNTGYCYQPPMPDCSSTNGLACSQVMPQKVCRLQTNPTNTSCASCVTPPDCIYANPPCQPAPPSGGWCTTTVTPTQNNRPTPTPIQFPAWFALVPQQHRNFLEMLYVYVFIFKQPSQLQHMLTAPGQNLFQTAPTPTTVP